MQIKDRVLLDDLRSHPGEVVALKECELHAGRPTGASILAGICQPDADGPGYPRYISVVYHFGRKAWHLHTEFSIQRASSWQPFALAEAVERFESVTGTKLPDIKIIDLGVGIYSARSRYTNDVTDPFALKDGVFYTVRDPKRGSRTLVADVRDGTARISFIDPENPTFMETYDPLVVLSAHEWRSLTPIDPAVTAVAYGKMALADTGERLPLQVLESAAGEFYIGTFDFNDGPVSRESVEYWPSKSLADAAFAKGEWTQRPVEAIATPTSTMAPTSRRLKP